MFRCLLIALVVGGCAKSSPAGMGELDLSVAVDLAVADDAASDAGAAVDAASDLAKVVYGDGGDCAPRINEVQTSVAGDAHWEYVELHNPCGDFDLDGWTLVYRSASNTAPRDGNDSGTLYVFGHMVVPRGGFVLLVGPSYTGASDGQLLGLGLADDGAVGLRDPGAHLVDSVAYGAVAANHAFIETAPAPKPPRTSAPGQSIARHPDGWDTNDNATDFSAGTPTPGGHN